MEKILHSSLSVEEWSLTNRIPRHIAASVACRHPTVEKNLCPAANIMHPVDRTMAGTGTVPCKRLKCQLSRIIINDNKRLKPVAV